VPQQATHPVDDAAELFAAGVVVASDDVTAVQCCLILVAGVAGAAQGDRLQHGQLRLDAD
jgi:hypothetical protein